LGFGLLMVSYKEILIHTLRLSVYPHTFFRYGS